MAVHVLPMGNALPGVTPIGPGAGAIAPLVAGAISFVYRPGGVAVGNIYSNFATLYTAFNAVSGLRIIVFDDSLAPCAIPVGTYSFAGADALGYSDAVSAAVTFSGATVITSFFARSYKVAFANDTTNALVTTAAGAHILMMQACSVTSTGALPFFLTTAGTLSLLLHESTIATGASAAVRTTGAGITSLAARDSSAIQTNSISDDAAGTTNVGYDSTSVVSQTQVVATTPPTYTRLADASRVAYTPTTAANWPTPTPDDVAEALDDIATETSESIGMMYVISHGVYTP